MEAQTLGPQSIKAYARHRKSLGLPGGTPPAVRKAMERLGIAKNLDGTIDADALHALWEAERGGGAESSDGGTAAADAGEPARDADPPAEGGNRSATSDVVSFAEARRRKEFALARNRELDVAEREGALIPIEVFTERLDIICERLASRVKGIGRFVGDVQRATSEHDARELLERMTEDLLKALREAGDDLDDDDDDGTGAVD